MSTDKSNNQPVFLSSPSEHASVKLVKWTRRGGFVKTLSAPNRSTVRKTGKGKRAMQRAGLTASSVRAARATQRVMERIDTSPQGLRSALRRAFRKQRLLEECR